MLLERKKKKIQLVLSVKLRPIQTGIMTITKRTDVGDLKLLRVKANYLSSFLSSAAYTLDI